MLYGGFSLQIEASGLSGLEGRVSCGFRLGMWLAMQRHVAETQAAEAQEETSLEIEITPHDPIQHQETETERGESGSR